MDSPFTYIQYIDPTFTKPAISHQECTLHSQTMVGRNKPGSEFQEGCQARHPLADEWDVHVELDTGFYACVGLVLTEYSEVARFLQ